MKRISPQESIAEAMRWVSKITNIGLSIAVPTVAGYGIDLWQGVSPWGVIGGGVLGSIMALQQVVLLTKGLNQADARNRGISKTVGRDRVDPSDRQQG
jgi:F0F1-type ATP synthase assembly protein I